MIEERITGTVKRFSDQKEFGFITPDDGSEDLFVHQSFIPSNGFRSFNEQAAVEDDNLIGTLMVRETIPYMGLLDCADTVIGSWHLRGISGGEKRRESIALEVLMRPQRSCRPSVACRGMDGRTVIASIHQPSSEEFELFDRLCFLSGGTQVYFSEVGKEKRQVMLGIACGLGGADCEPTGAMCYSIPRALLSVAEEGLSSTF